MRARILKEWRRLVRGTRSLDALTSAVLTLYGVFVVLHYKFGGRGFFLTHVAPEASALHGWIWWFGIQAVTGFVLPVLVLLVLFRQRPAAMGLGLGDWRLALIALAVYLPVVVAGTWVLSDGAEFQAAYPHYRPAATDWRLFWMYHAAFVLYWVGWEYLWRGFVLFGTARTLGLHAIFVQAVPFALLHLQKPAIELGLSLLGGIALGALVWRCRAFWIAVPVHAAQMLALDIWCSLRGRTGVSGTGLDALWTLMRTAGGG